MKPDKDKKINPANLNFGGVHPVYKLSDFYKSLKSCYLSAYGEEYNCSRMLALLFIRPDNYLSKSEILPNLNYFHVHSGVHLDFFCPGYKIIEADNLEGLRLLKDIPCIEGKKWAYSEEKFNDFWRAFSIMKVDDSVEENEKFKRRWKYSGQSDLLLTSYTYDGKNVSIFYNGTIAINLEDALKAQAINSAEKFLTEVSNYAESNLKNNPNTAFWVSQNINIAKKTICKLFLKIFPKEIREEVVKSSFFIPVDINPLIK